MVKTPLTSEQNVKKIRQVRLCLFICGVVSLFTALLNIFTRSFNPQYEGVQILLGVGCIVFGFTLTKKIKKILEE
ncbi:hypothetical protein HRF90_09625 [Klebsiella michiganensis]|uniref:hypothetical protein n=1 Tax=Klebsiella TaxID=570 RepID=UPI001157FA68|nr:MULTISPECIES: hypothetical protein [Klebsiella]NRE85743.1 hypothetical protein [Klebsiella michiganensis]VUS69870.1 hypothetical protein SB6412_03477 [Klebsiella pasteurii]VUS98908.1 hypothetical protein SPARK1531C2_04043 [Klebsiella grimontii]VUT19074.1 hypothetical protein SB6415_04319 [Klebsiella pasteurii]